MEKEAESREPELIMEICFSTIMNNSFEHYGMLISNIMLILAVCQFKAF